MRLICWRLAARYSVIIVVIKVVATALIYAFCYWLMMHMLKLMPHQGYNIISNVSNYKRLEINIIKISTINGIDASADGSPGGCSTSSR